MIEHYENDVLISTETKSYTYNYMNQLVEATIDGEHIDYFYDAYGNLTQENNTTSNSNTYYTYDLKNQLVTFTDGTETLEFEYDGSGNRTSKSITTGTSTETVSYINDITKPNEEVISLTYNSTVTNYTYGLDRLYEGDEEYLHDSYGNVIEHASETYEYTPYGELISGTIDGVNEYGYKGEVHDTDSLQYLRARYYHTSLMQFISEDTYTGKDTNPLSQNRYTFVKNNPFKYSDPSGHWPNWNKFKEDTSNFFKKNGQAISGALNVAAGFGQMFVGATLVGTGVGAAIGATMFAYGASNALEGAQDIYHGVRHDGKTSVNIIRSGFETVGKAVGGEKGKKIATGVYYASEFALDTLSGKAAFSAVNKVAKTSKATKATTVLGKIGASLDDTADIIKITTKSHVDNLLKAGANGLSKLKSAATDIPGTFNKIKDAGADLYHAGRNKWDNGIEFISRQKDNLVNSYKNVKSGIGNKFNTVKETISAADEKLSAKIYDYVNNLGGNQYAYADGPYAGSVPSSSRTKGMFSETIDTVGDTTKSVKESKNVANLTQSKIKEILSLDKGLRPNPSTYLSEDYITNHLSLFDEGVTKFSWTKPTRPVGPPGGTFVMPKSVADDLIIEAGGDVKKLEELLGLNLGDLGDAPVRIDIADPIGLRMPDGNELGANNFWVPGGYTSGGIPEATIDQTSLSDIVVNEIFK